VCLPHIGFCHVCVKMGICVRIGYTCQVPGDNNISKTNGGVGSGNMKNPLSRAINQATHSRLFPKPAAWQLIDMHDHRFTRSSSVPSKLSVLIKSGPSFIFAERKKVVKYMLRVFQLCREACPCQKRSLFYDSFFLIKKKILSFNFKQN